MKRVSNSAYKLYAIEAGEESPLEKHLAGEIAYETRPSSTIPARFYIHEMFLITWGVDAVDKAIDSLYRKLNILEGK